MGVLICTGEPGDVAVIQRDDGTVERFSGSAPGISMKSSEPSSIQGTCTRCGKSISVWGLMLCVDCLQLWHEQQRQGQQVEQENQLAIMKQAEDGEKLAEDKNGTGLFVRDIVIFNDRHLYDNSEVELRCYELSRFYRDLPSGQRELIAVSPADSYQTGITILQPDELILIRRQR